MKIVGAACVIGTKPLNKTGWVYDNPFFLSRNKSTSVKRAERQSPSTSPSSIFPQVNCPPNNPAWNKLIAMQCIQDRMDLNPANMDKYVQPNLINHLNTVADGLDAYIAAVLPGGVAYDLKGGKPAAIIFEHVSAIEDFVWLHMRKAFVTGEVTTQLVLYRLECGKIIEHWYVGQVINATAPVYNPHPYF